MKRVQAAVCKNQLFITPAFGIIRVSEEHKHLFKDRDVWRACFAWLRFRVAITVWKSDWKEY